MRNQQVQLVLCLNYRINRFPECRFWSHGSKVGAMAPVFGAMAPKLGAMAPDLGAMAPKTGAMAPKFMSQWPRAHRRWSHWLRMYLKFGAKPSMFRRNNYQSRNKFVRLVSLFSVLGSGPTD